MMEKTLNLQRDIQIQSQNTIQKTNGKDDFKKFPQISNIKIIEL
jgi:hypothetical protein